MNEWEYTSPSLPQHRTNSALGSCGASREGWAGRVGGVAGLSGEVVGGVERLSGMARRVPWSSIAPQLLLGQSLVS